ncbi:thioredoxin family protein [Candidatus Woesearchaeota archaeon]|nr:thioredoxin family protein [Candidatus Woesearchaeota archaeon]
MEEDKHITHKHKIKKIVVWQISTAVLVVLLIISVFMGGFSKGSSSGLTAQAAADKTIKFINQNLLQGQGKATLKSVEESGNLYRLKLDVNGQELDSYVTKDGQLLFPQAINLDETLEIPEQTPQQAPAQGLEKSDKPVIELFVMSHCPYGTQMEKGIIPVVDLLGDKIDFQLKFVNYAMHEQKEIDEQLNQYCIQKEYPDHFIDYLKCFLEEGKGDECIVKEKLDSSKISSCVEKADKEFGITEDYNDKSKWRGRFPPFNIYDSDNEKYGVRGSPTLVINGKTISSGRDAVSLLNTICSAFNDKPEECNTDLSAEGNPSPGFGFNTASAPSSAGGCGG